MASTTAVCNAFKIDLFLGEMNFTVATDIFRWSLHTATEVFDKTTTAFSATNEISGTNYTTRGVTVANVTPVLSGDSAIMDWPDPTWSAAAFTADSTLLWNDTIASPVDASVGVWDFGGPQTASGGDFVLELDVPAAGTAILEIA